MSKEELEKRIRSVRAEVSDYLDTVQGVYALCHEMRWDNDRRMLRSSVESPFCIGRRMTTSPANRIRPNEEVTPDLVVQLTPSYGIVGEARVRFPSDEDQRLEKMRQLEKYDDDLQGWYTETETIPVSDLVLLTHDDDVVKASDYIHAMLTAGKAHLDRAFSVVGSLRETSRFGDEQIRLRKAYGSLSNQDLDGRLREGRQIRLETLVNEYGGRMELYDQEPPLAHMMRLIWTDVLPLLIGEDQFLASRDKTPLMLRVSSDDLTNRMRSMFCADTGSDRVPGFPRQTWVRRALDVLCRLRYAVRDGDEYSITYKHIKDPKESFIKGFCRLDLREQGQKGKKKQSPPDQLNLGMFD